MLEKFLVENHELINVVEREKIITGKALLLIPDVGCLLFKEFIFLKSYGSLGMGGKGSRFKNYAS